MSAKACPKHALLIQGKPSPLGAEERERGGREREERGSQKMRLGGAGKDQDRFPVLCRPD